MAWFKLINLTQELTEQQQLHIKFLKADKQIKTHENEKLFLAYAEELDAKYNITEWTETEMTLEEIVNLFF